ncbi:MAG: cysteine hydrolase family protein, partial [Solirubrobacteraceae bacterium]
IDHLVLTGQVTEQCILYSSLDAYVRHLGVTVVRDAVAHIDREQGQAALELMERNMAAEIVRAEDCRLDE